ncbi:UNVERIFIED_CONTAM: major ampullate spidroin protein MaSp-e [Trichonephila clavipes]
MTWTNKLALICFAILCTQSMYVLGQVNPWSNVESADKFVTNFLSFVEKSGVFDAEQMRDMSAFGRNDNRCTDKMARSGEEFKKKVKSLDMAFASSIAEIAVKGGQNVAQKAGQLQGAINEAFLQNQWTENK